ncbi:putative Ufm1-specific protease [Drosera capensis]
MMRECLRSDGVGCMMGGAVVDGDEGKVRFFVSESRDASDVERVNDVVYVEEEKAGREVWENGCLVWCEVPIRLSVYVPVDKKTDAEQLFLQTTDGLIARLKDPKLTCSLENTQNSSDNAPRPVAIHDNKLGSEVASTEHADAIQATLMLNRSVSSSKSAAPVAEYYPALDEARLSVVEYKLEVLCYAAKQLPLTYAVSKLIIPTLTDQVTTMKNAIVPAFLEQHPQARLATLRAYHFCPPGFLFPITVIYELSYGETEIKQVLDDMITQVANALGISNGVGASKGSTRKVPFLLRDVHAGIPSSGGESIGLFRMGLRLSLIADDYRGSGFNTILHSMFPPIVVKIFTTIQTQSFEDATNLELDVFREIQQTLVDIGDKDPSFIGSREWIGAIELSYVLDKLLGVKCETLVLSYSILFVLLYCSLLACLFELWSLVSPV